MELEIFWTEFAEEELFKIFSYYNHEAGYKVAKKLTDGIFGEPHILK